MIGAELTWKSVRSFINEARYKSLVRFIEPAVAFRVCSPLPLFRILAASFAGPQEGNAMEGTVLLKLPRGVDGIDGHKSSRKPIKLLLMELGFRSANDAEASREAGLLDTEPSESGALLKLVRTRLPSPAVIT